MYWAANAYSDCAPIWDHNEEQNNPSWVLMELEVQWGKQASKKKKKNPHTINNLSIIVESALKEIREFCNWDLNRAWESAKIS